MTVVPPRDESAQARIAAHLRKLIAEGDLAPGERAPSEQQLADEFEVSRMTARRAVDQLRIEGLLVSIGDRRGTFVQDYPPLITYLNLAERGTRRDNPSMALDDWEASVKAQGRKPYQKVTVHLDELATNLTSRWLGVAPGSPLVRRHRYREVDDVPSQIVDSWFPEDIAAMTLPGTDRQPLREDDNVVVAGGILHGLGQDQVRLERRDSARNADPRTAATLDIATGAALLVSRWTGYRADGRAVRVMVITAAGDRNEFVDMVDLAGE